MSAGSLAGDRIMVLGLGVIVLVLVIGGAVAFVALTSRKQD